MPFFAMGGEMSYVVGGREDRSVEGWGHGRGVIWFPRLLFLRTLLMLILLC